jgi:hypothetical protein
MALGERFDVMSVVIGLELNNTFEYLGRLAGAALLILSLVSLMTAINALLLPIFPAQNQISELISLVSVCSSV